MPQMTAAFIAGIAGGVNTKKSVGIWPYFALIVVSPLLLSTVEDKSVQTANAISGAGMYNEIFSK